MQHEQEAEAELRAISEAWAAAIVADEWTTDVFVRRAGRRRCVLSHITPTAGEPA